MEQVNVKQHFRADETPFIDHVNEIGRAHV